MRKGAFLLAIALTAAISTNAMAAKKVVAAEVRDPYYMKARAAFAVLTLLTVTPFMTYAIQGLDKEPVVKIKK